VGVVAIPKPAKTLESLPALDVSTGYNRVHRPGRGAGHRPAVRRLHRDGRNRLPDATRPITGAILAAGVNVVGSSAGFPRSYPWQVLPRDLLAPIEDAARGR